MRQQIVDRRMPVPVAPALTWIGAGLRAKAARRSPRVKPDRSTRISISSACTCPQNSSSDNCTTLRHRSALARKCAVNSSSVTRSGIAGDIEPRLVVAGQRRPEGQGRGVEPEIAGDIADPDRRSGSRLFLCCRLDCAAAFARTYPTNSGAPPAALRFQSLAQIPARRSGR